MASTYKLISSVTVGSGGTSTIAFTSIPNTYTHLLFRLSIRCLAGGNDDQLRVNFNNTGVGNTTLNKVIQGNGLGSVGTSNSSTWIIGGFNGNGTTANTFTDAEIFIPNYLSSLNKNFYVDSAMETNAAQCYTEITAGVWENTAAITSVAFLTPSVNFAQYSTAYLYGIEIPANQITPKATGGDITYDNNYVYHTFRQSGTFTPTQSVSADCLVLAGGGAGGGAYGGGGGAGGFRVLTSQSFTSSTAYTVTVGGGGAAATGNYSGGTAGGSGSNSSISGSGFSTISSTGGGGGGTHANNQYGANGGSGGGGSLAATSGGSGNAGSYSPSEGNNGASASNPNYNGGGGGAGAAATNQNGGIGTSSYSSWGVITLTGHNVGGTTYYAGGGGGGGQSPYATGTGGSGGGGNGIGSGQGASGLINTGGGGGGSGNNFSGTGSTGGSGLVIVRYAR